MKWLKTRSDKLFEARRLWAKQSPAAVQSAVRALASHQESPEDEALLRHAAYLLWKELDHDA